MISGNSGCAREIIANLSALLNLCTVAAGRRNTGHVRTTLQIITKATKSSNANCSKTSHLLGTVVDLIESWHTYDRKHGGRLIQIRKGFLILLSTMTMVKQNRVKLSDLDLMQKLYNVCDGMIRKNAPDQLTKILINTMHKCIPMIKPVATVPDIDSEIDLLSETASSIRLADGEIPSVSEQYPEMSIFDTFFPERDDIPPAQTVIPPQLTASNQTLRGPINLPKLMIKRRKSTTNLPQGVTKNQQSLSLPNLVFPKVSGSNKSSTPTVSPRVQSQKLNVCIKCIKLKLTTCEHQTPTTAEMLRDNTRGYAIGPCAHSTQMQTDIQIAARDTRMIDRFSDTKISNITNIIPCCEVYGQMTTSPAAQARMS